MKRRLLDLYCCEGGAARGYSRAGWAVYGVDLFTRNVQRRYPFASVKCSALDVLADLLAGRPVVFTHHDGTTEALVLADFGAIHASPPCQPYSRATAGNVAARENYARLIPATRRLLCATGLPWVIENVEQAAAELVNPVLLCGRMFGLEALDADGTPLVLDRHRLFESNVLLTPPAHPTHDARQVAGVYGGARRAKRRPGESLADVAPRDRHEARYVRRGGYVPRSRQVQQQLLGLGDDDRMTLLGMNECIPPVYAEWIGRRVGPDVRVCGVYAADLDTGKDRHSRSRKPPRWSGRG